MMDKFWMVHGIGMALALLVVARHPHRIEATQEAARLARKHPGTSFVVLESMGDYRREDITWTPHNNLTK